MAALTKFDVFSENLAEKVHNLDTDTLKVYLTNTTPSVSADFTITDLAEISAGNGYTAGGFDIQNATSRTGGTTSLTAVDVVITAAGGAIGPFRYAPIYNDTSTSPADPLLFYWDYGSSLTMADGESILIDFPSTIMTVA